MNKNRTNTYEQSVNDAGNVLVAEFTAQITNDVVQNIKLSVNTIDGYQTNKEKVIVAFDDFLQIIQSETIQTSDETEMNVIESDVDVTSTLNQSKEGTI
ncbi:MAG: hypothetical protein [Bacteriophage sp.]|nr:MAG: hypothetical protein [Bacteriophage sp.]